jgi:hypothetical protein
MKVWIAFLLLSFVVGGWSMRRNKRERFWLVFGLCVIVAFALQSQRWV